MIIIKTRIIIVSLVALAGFAATSAIPSASQAQFLHYCVDGHCVTAPNALSPKSATLGGAGKSQCEATKVAFETSKVPIDPGLPTNGPIVTTIEDLGGGPIVEESNEKKEEAARQKEHEKAEAEARAAEAERAAFESGCDPTGLHTK